MSLNFALKQNKFSISEIENMIPWEREIYVDLLEQHLQKMEEEMRKNK
jgi:hypothetical protein